MPETTHIPVNVIEGFMVDVFKRLGVPEDEARISADVLITSETAITAWAT
jgi:LDH2 family malate/lactate/ureidoglycolate dehydrogenase